MTVARPTTPRIEEIRIQNFRALENVRLPVSDLTFLVGRNGAGKSSVLDAIELLREAVRDSLPNALARRDGFAGVYRAGASTTDAPLGIAVVMRTEIGDRAVRMLYGFRLTPDSDRQHIQEALRVSPTRSLGYFRDGVDFTSDSGVRPALASDRLALPLVATEQLWQLAFDALANMRSYSIAPAALAAPALIRNTTNLDRDGGNAGDVMQAISEDPVTWAELLRTLGAVVPGLLDVSTELSLGRRTLSFLQELGSVHRRFNAGQMSQGTLRALGLLLALHQQPRPSLVLIDEIEDSIHPHALEAILEAAEGFTDRFPLVITTHSPEVLSTKQVTPDRLRIMQWEQGISRVYPLSTGTKDSVDRVTTVGDLLRFNALWPSDAPDQIEGALLDLAP